MRLKNSTDFTDTFLRRMVSWCCKEVGLPVRWLKRATFRKARKTYRDVAFSGLGGGHGIIVRIGPESAFPTHEFHRHLVRHVEFNDRIEALVGVTAHECYHCDQSRRRAFKGASHDEPAAMQAERSAVEAFRANRDALLAEWIAPVQERVRTVVSISERREAKALADLAKWERKLSLAKGKVRKYTARVRYYEKKAASKHVGENHE